jgi:hypothetical protein
MAVMKKPLVVSLLCALAVLLAAAPACADRGDRGRFDQRFGRMDDRPAFGMERRERMQESRRDEGHGFGRMSPEERRQLRHDIRSVGEGIYRRPPPPPPPGYGQFRRD